MRNTRGFCVWMCVAATLLAGMFLNVEVGQAVTENTKIKVLKCDNLEISVPAECGGNQINLSSEAKPNLSGIKLPNGFCLVSVLYKFEPTEILNDKKILVEFKIDPKMIPAGLKLEDLSIFCLSQNSKQLIEVYDQQCNQKNMILSANLNYSKYRFLIGTNIKTAQGVVVKKAAPASGGGKHCEGGVCPL